MMLINQLRWALAGALAGLLLAAGAFVLLQRSSAGGARAPLADPPAMVRQIQQLQEIVSVKYVVQKVIGLEEKKVPVGSEKILLIVQAEVLAGVDLTPLSEADVRREGAGAWAIRLPPPRILHVVIDDQHTQVWDRKITWWTPWVPYNPDLERQARLAAREAIEKAALEMGILDHARRSVEASIQSLLRNAGARSVRFLHGT
jgi:hypothetical protein